MNKILCLYSISRITFLVFAMLGLYFFPLDSGYLGKQVDSSVPAIVWEWANFDGRHYIDIAASGYRNTNFAFFPLYPLLISIFGNFFQIPFLYSGIFISLASFLVALVFIWKIIRLDYKKDIAQLAVFLICFYPLSFFYNSVYADSQFLLFSTASFYFARRGNWILAGIFGGLTTLTRLSGLALIPALLFEWISQNLNENQFRWKVLLPRFLKSKAMVCLLLTTLGFVSYLVYLQIFFGNWLLFQTSFSAWKQDEVVLLPQVLFRYIKIFLTVDMSLLVYWIAVFEFLSFFLYMGLAIYVWKKIRVSYGIFMIVLLLLVTFTGTFAGTPRYILHLFPGFLGMSVVLENKPKLKTIVFFAFIVLGFVLTGLFTSGHFIG